MHVTYLTLYNLVCPPPPSPSSRSISGEPHNVG